MLDAFEIVRKNLGLLGNALLVTIRLREVVIVETQATLLSAENQLIPEKTAPVQNGGSRAAKPVAESILSKLFG